MKKRNFFLLYAILFFALIQLNFTHAQTWKSIGPGPIPDRGFGNVSGRIISNAASSKGLYIGVDQGGLWRSKNFENGSPSWENITDKFIRSVRKKNPLLSRSCTYVQSIIIDPVDPNIIYAIVGGNGLKIIKSIDAGDNWNDISINLPGGQYQKLIVDPYDNNKLFLVVNSQLFQSTNAGKSWMPFKYPNTDLPPHIQYMDMDYTTENIPDNIGKINYIRQTLILYYVLRNLDTKQIEVYQVRIAETGGSSWGWTNLPVDWKDFNGNAFLTDLIPQVKIAANHSNTNTLNFPKQVFLAAFDGTHSSLKNVFKLVNQGKNDFIFSPSKNNGLTSIDCNNGSAVGACSFGISPFYGKLYLAGVREFYQSTNQGDNWMYIGAPKNPKDPVQKPHHDNHSITFYNDKAYFGGDGGIYRFNPLPNNQPGANTWESLNTASLPTSLPNSATMNPVDENNIICGMQDNSIGVYKNGIWQSESGLGDVGPVRFDPNPTNNGNNAYCTSVSAFSFFFRRNINGVWEDKSPKDAETQQANIDWYSKFAINPKNTSQIALGIDRIYETFDKGNSWGNGAASQVFTKDKANATAISYAPDGSLWAVYGNFLYHRDINNKWLPPTLTNQYISIKPDFNIGNFPPNGNGLNYDMYLASRKNISKYNSITEEIRKIADQPNNDEKINAIEYINDPSVFPLKLLFAATEAGIYYSIVESGKPLQWNDFTGNLSYPNITDVEYNQNLKMLTISTWGRGAYTINLKDALRTIFKPSINNTTLKVQIFDGITFLGRNIGNYIDYQDYLNKYQYFNYNGGLFKNCNTPSLFADKWHRVTMQYKSPANIYGHDIDILNFYNKELKYSDDLSYSCPNNDQSCINTIATLKRPKEVNKLIGEWSTPFLTGPDGSYLSVTTEVYDSKGIISAGSFPFAVISSNNLKAILPQINDISIQSIDGCHQIYDNKHQPLAFSLDIKGFDGCSDIDTITWRYIVYDRNMNMISQAAYDSIKVTDPTIIFNPIMLYGYGYIGKITATIKFKNGFNSIITTPNIYLTYPDLLGAKNLLRLQEFDKNKNIYTDFDFNGVKCNGFPSLKSNTQYRFTLMTPDETLVKAKDIVSNYSYTIPLFGKAVIAAEKNKIPASYTDADNLWSHFITGADGTSLTISLTTYFKNDCNTNASLPFVVNDPVTAQIIDVSNNSLDGCHMMYDTGKQLTFALNFKKPACLDVDRIHWYYKLYDPYGEDIISDPNHMGGGFFLIPECDKYFTTTDPTQVFVVPQQSQLSCLLGVTRKLQGFAKIYARIFFKNNNAVTDISTSNLFIYYNNIEKVGDYLTKLQVYDNNLKQYVNYDWKQKKDNNAQYTLTPNSQFRFTLRSPNEIYIKAKDSVINYSISYQCQGMGCNSFMNEVNKIPADDNNDAAWSHFSTGASGAITINLSTKYKNGCNVAKLLPFTVNKPVPKSSKEEQGPIQWASNSSNFNIVPNPNSGIFSITTPGNITNAQIEITDAAGRSILKQNIHQLSDKRFNLSHYAKGIYYIKIKADKYSAGKKVVIQ